MREPVFRGVTRGVRRHGHAGHDKRCDRKTCLAPDVFVTFDVDRRVGQSYKIWEVGKPPRIVWEFGSAGTAAGGGKKERYQVCGCRNTDYTPPTADRTGVSTRLPIGGRELRVAAGEVP